MSKRYLIVLVLIFPLNSLAMDSLCQSNENNIFSCTTTKAKTISLCASKNLNPTTGYLQYRFGSKSNIELNFPSKKTHPKGNFTKSGSVFSGGVTTYLSFVSGPYRYILYDIFSSKTVIGNESSVDETHTENLGVAILKSNAIADGDEWSKKDFVSISQCKRNQPLLSLPNGVIEREDFLYFPQEVHDKLIESKELK